MRDAQIDQIINRWLGAVSSGLAAYREDAMYHAQIEQMRRLLETFDLAMEQEGIPPGMRHRVLEKVMMAAPDAREAQIRVERVKEFAEKMRLTWPTHSS